jgi:uncharacterized protein (TIGR02391 family)
MARRSSPTVEVLDLARNLGASAPDQRVQSDPALLDFDRRICDSELANVVRSRFVSGHYADAVESAAKFLVALVSRLSGLEGDLDGTGLMTTAFSPGNPTLRVNPGRTKTDKVEQLGYMCLFGGVVSAFRNPRAHRADTQDDPATALMMIELIDHLVGVARRSKTSAP